MDAARAAQMKTRLAFMGFPSRVRPRLEGLVLNSQFRRRSYGVLPSRMHADDQLHLTHAQGWLVLGDWKSARSELAQITPARRAHPDVLLCWVEAFGFAGRWEKAAMVARTLTTRLSTTEGVWRAHYALARCEAHLGHYAAAEIALHYAVQQAPMDIRQMALDDPELDPLWKNIGKA